MKDTPKIEGLPDPRSPKDVSKNDRIDPEKFKKVLRVDESDETQKRHSRQRTKQEEEEEEEEIGPTAPPPPNAFSGLMSSEKKKPSIFDVEGGTKQTGSIETPSTKKTPFNLMSDTEESQAEVPPTEETPLSTEQESSTPDLHDDQRPQEAFSNESVESDASSEPSLPSERKTPKKRKHKVEAEGAEKPQPPKKKPHKVTGAPLVSPKPMEKEKTNEKPLDKLPIDEMPAEPSAPLSPTASEEEDTEVVAEQLEQPLPPHQEIRPSEPSMKKEGPSEKAIPSVSSPIPKKREEPFDHPDKHEEKPSQVVDSTAAITPPPLEQAASVSAAPPAYAKLPHEIFELFEKMVGVMTIEKDHGVSTTTVTLNMKNSVFDGCKIEIKHYSTAPNAFNVQLQGSPKAVNYMNQNLSDLTAALQQSKLTFQVNMLRPTLLDEYRTVRRKEGAADEEDQEGGQPSG